MRYPSEKQLSPPTAWETFEKLSRDLWSHIWSDPLTKRNGRIGYPQCGVDVYGQPQGETQYSGVQCKKKDNLAGTKLSTAELEEEVKKAKTFKPKLSHFIVATTGPRDPKIEERARELSTELQSQNQFRVTVFAWEDILEQLDNFPWIAEKYYGLGPGLIRLEKMLKQIERHVNPKRKPKKPLDKPTILLLDEIEKLVNGYFPQKALEALERIRKSLWSTASNKIKFRITALQGTSLTKLANYKEASRYLESTYKYDKTEKGLINLAYAMYLRKKTNSSRYYAEKVLQKNPNSSPAIAILFHCLQTTANITQHLSRLSKDQLQNPDIMIGIAAFYEKKGDLEASIDWTQKALGIAKHGHAELQALLGTRQVLYCGRIRSKFITYSESEQEKALLEKGITNLTKSITTLDGTDLCRQNASNLAARSLGYEVENKVDRALADIEKALDVNSNDPRVRLRAAYLFTQNNMLEKSQKLLEYKFPQRFKCDVLEIENIILFLQKDYSQAHCCPR